MDSIKTGAREFQVTKIEPKTEVYVFDDLVARRENLVARRQTMLDRVDAQIAELDALIAEGGKLGIS